MEIVATTVDQKEHHIKYNNGDQIWYIMLNDQMLVTKVISHDGVTWQTGNKDLKHR